MSLCWPRFRKTTLQASMPGMLWCLPGTKWSDGAFSAPVSSNRSSLGGQCSHITKAVLERQFVRDRWKAKYFLCCRLGSAHEECGIHQASPLLLNVLLKHGTSRHISIQLLKYILLLFLPLDRKKCKCWCKTHNCGDGKDCAQRNTRGHTCGETMQTYPAKKISACGRLRDC